MASRAPAAKQKRREEIIDVATALLGSKGYGHTTMDDIAAAANVTKRTLYRYVPTKQDILPMIHERFLRAAEDLNYRYNSEDDPTKQVLTFIRSFVTVLVEHQNAVRVFFEEQYNLPPEARSKIVDRRDAFERGFRDLVRAGQRAGAFRQWDVDIAAFGVFGAVGSIYLWYSPSGEFGIEELSGLMSDLLVGGLAEAVPRASKRPHKRASRLEQTAEAVGVEPTKLPPPVIEAATRLFATRGYLETNTREIAEAAGVTKSGLFYHIGSKEDLLYALNLQFCLARLDDLRQVQASQGLGDPGSHFRRLVINHSRIMEKESASVRISLDQHRYLTEDNRARIDALHRQYVDGFERVIRDGIDAGVFKRVHPHVTALTLLGMLNWMSRWYRSSGRLTANQVGAVFADLFLQGLAEPS
ncbi:TetR family transcriptional regulator [Rhodococcus sp. DMU1]|uniref:TetR family transcriptional regulator n=1 Tax=Rhodococcus sp. DMU1 TaxID=2722825 RepID=UPI00143ECBAD|nr:TetR family transcriptional regulator [Rhodococcus sp. DMU1]QIX53610.1 TetR/AcrR family transcriptional regulator [Rhodococcus sp. DMU1]